MKKENNQMVELSDEELLDMVGGYVSPSSALFVPVVAYGIGIIGSILNEILKK